jgi:hypothetical protein
VDDDDLTVLQLCYELGVHRGTLRHAIKEGTLVPTGHKGNRLLFSRAYMNQLKDNAREAGATGWLAAALRRLKRKRIPVEDDPDRSLRSARKSTAEYSAPDKRIHARPVVPLEPEGDETDLSINDLAYELDVTRRTIERALKDGQLIPTGHKGKRVRFSREYADRLK